MDPTPPVRASIELREIGNHTENEVSSNAPNRHSTESNVRGLRFTLLTIGLVLSIFLAALDSSILSTAIPKITDHFGTVRDVGWYSTAYFITNAAFQTTWGRAVRTQITSSQQTEVSANLYEHF